MSLTTDTTMQVVPANCNGNSNGMWGGEWSSWIILFLIFGLFGGWGNGFGAGGQNGGVGSEVQRGFDHSAVVNKLDGLTQGLCDSTYAVTNAVNSGFHSVDNGFHGVDNAICSLGNTMQQSQNALSAQLAQYCCDNREAVDQMRYDMAIQACDTRNTIQNTTRDIIDNQNANSRAILDALNANYVRSLENENQGLKLAASQSNQNAVLMAAMDANKAEILRRTGAECPTPAYVVQPPQPVTFPNFCNSGCGCGNGCGC